MRKRNCHDHVSRWIENVRLGDEAAAGLLWQHCFVRVAAFARRQMYGRMSSLADEEDIALSAIKSLCLGLRAGRFDALEGDDSLWRLLFLIAARKVSDQVAYDTRQKRNVNRLESFFQGDADEPSLFPTCTRPTPDTEAELTEQLKQLLDSLERDDLRQIAIMKMDGYTNEEIAKRLDRGLSTVERKLRLIRAIWSAED